jgi:hypothetical protein
MESRIDPLASIKSVNAPNRQHARISGVPETGHKRVSMTTISGAETTRVIDDR